MRHTSASLNPFMSVFAFSAVALSQATFGQEKSNPTPTDPNSEQRPVQSVLEGGSLNQSGISQAATELTPNILKENYFQKDRNDYQTWKWVPEQIRYAQSVVKVETSEGNGTGVLISIDHSKPIQDGYEGVMLTAAHVVCKQTNGSFIKDQNGNYVAVKDIKAEYSNGRRAVKSNLLCVDEKNDAALVLVWVHKDIPVAQVSKENVKPGEKVVFVGLGGNAKLDCCLRVFSGEASDPTSDDKIFADTALLPGDSGGPVFNEKYEVVGTISGGWMWYKASLNNPTEVVPTVQTRTWPARSCNVGPVQELFKKIRKLNN